LDELASMTLPSPTVIIVIPFGLSRRRGAPLSQRGIGVREASETKPEQSNLFGPLAPHICRTQRERQAFQLTALFVLINRGCSKAFQTYDFFGSFEPRFVASGFHGFRRSKCSKTLYFRKF
jgi:hypothetical protein